MATVPVTPGLAGRGGLDIGAWGLGPSDTVIDDTRSGGMVGGWVSDGWGAGGALWATDIFAATIAGSADTVKRKNVRWKIIIQEDVMA